MDAVDVTLASIAQALQLLPGARETRNREIHWLLREHLRSLPFVRAIWIVDGDGRMIHDSDDLPGTYTFVDREYFRVHRDGPDLGMHIDRPIVSRLGVWFVAASRRMERRDGGFAAWWWPRSSRGTSTGSTSRSRWARRGWWH